MFDLESPVPCRLGEIRRGYAQAIELLYLVINPLMENIRVQHLQDSPFIAPDSIGQIVVQEGSGFTSELVPICFDGDAPLLALF
ncbi:hypothetical protein PITCH_A230007 [uncultured Desulfobacterium sp.]|uniref:Uncharacterized protein n=1 Tax=uncultured Desulfobacterium sp. TaxID=201089 RepID=A0A445MY85_9BACT|nr:hypothetical protein PITCH_A230007 [uncultured Desulfobacterium sp.]